MSLIQRLRYFVSHNRITTSLAIGLAFILLSRPTPRSILIGVPIILVGEFFRTLSSGYLEKNASISIGGPYSITRNPLYVGNFLIGLGFVIVANRPILLPFFLFLFGFIYHATIEEEEKNLHKRYGDVFLSYKASVPRFFPRLWQWRGNGQSFDWSLVIKHREYLTWLGIMGVIFVLAAKMFVLR
jgi:steroid 5-alpha reductase family enzyme